MIKLSDQISGLQGLDCQNVDVWYGWYRKMMPESVFFKAFEFLTLKEGGLEEVPGVSKISK